MEQDNGVSELRREIAGFRLGLFLVAVIVLGLLTFWNLLSVTFIPQFEKIFEDMLGSREKLPDLTKWVIDYGRGAGGLLPYAVVFSCCAFTFAVMNWMRKSWKFILAGIAGMFLLVMHALVLGFALVMPLMQIIVGINERSP